MGVLYANFLGACLHLTWGDFHLFGVPINSHPINNATVLLLGGANTLWPLPVWTCLCGSQCRSCAGQALCPGSGVAERPLEKMYDFLNLF